MRKWLTDFNRKLFSQKNPTSYTSGQGPNYFPIQYKKINNEKSQKLINIYLQTLLGLQIHRLTKRSEEDLTFLHESSKKTMTFMDIVFDKSSCILALLLF